MDIINISVGARKADIAKCKADVLAVGMFSDDKKPVGVAAEIDKKLGGAIAKVMKLGDFKAKANATTVVYTNGAIAATRVLLVGLGERKKATIDKIRKAAASAANQAVAMQAKTMAVAIHQACEKQIKLATEDTENTEVNNKTSNTSELEKHAQAIAEGVYFGAYRWDEYLKKKKTGTRKSCQ